MERQIMPRSPGLLGLMCQLERKLTAPTDDSMHMFCLLGEPSCQNRILVDYLLIIFSVRIFQAEGAQLLQELPVPNVVDISFSPRGTYISTWERPGMSCHHGQ